MQFNIANQNDNWVPQGNHRVSTQATKKGKLNL